MIITLPITVKNDAPLGYWLTPILADALSRQLNERGVVYYGKLGLKKPDSAAEATYLGNLDLLQVRAERRTDESVAPELLALCDDLALVGNIETRHQDCFRCPCERLELPVRIAHFAKEKTFVRTGGRYICRACGESGTVQRVSNDVLVLDELDISGICIYPNWYRGEVLELHRQLHEQGIPWSKSRQTELCGCLDPELVWSLIPLLLSRTYPQERVRIVITNHVIRQALVAVVLARALDPSFEADLVIMPVIDHPGSLKKWELSRLVDLGFSDALLRCMLIGSLGWHTKSVRLYDTPSGVEYRRFELFVRHVRSAETCRSFPYDLIQAFQNLSHQNLALGLKHVFNLENFDYRRLTGVV